MQVRQKKIVENNLLPQRPYRSKANGKETLREVE